MDRSLRRAERAAIVALVVTVVLSLAKLGVWMATSSLAVLSQAVDSALDIVALVLLLLAVRIATRPADESHHYGHGKAENLAAFAQTIILLVVVGGIVVEAVKRLGGDPAAVEAPWYALGLLGLSAIVDGFRVAVLLRAARREGSEALRAGAVNFATDIGTAVVALVSLLLVRSGVERADSIGGLIVAGAVVVAAWRLGRRSVGVLMDRSPGDPVGAIAAAAARAAGVSETRRVRVRSGGSRLFADVTVAAGRTASLERAHDITEAVEREIERVAPGADVVVHVEPTSETSGYVERAQAAASRAEGVHEVHNVLVHEFTQDGRGKLHVTLHAKVGPSTPLQEAHDLSERIERAVTEELGAQARVDTHLEPLETSAVGTDVTRSRVDVVTTIRRIALGEADVLDCHEVLVTDAGGELSVTAHVRGRRDLPLARIHAASQRIEKSIHSQLLDVGPVVIHFEPD
jgi:cation diffusion facilitator family transporter